MKGRTSDQIDRRWQVSPRDPDGTRRRAGTPFGPVRITPTRATLGVALVGSTVFLLYAITVRDASQIPLLSTGSAILGIAFGALALSGAVSTYRAAAAGLSGRAFGLALAGGLAALVAAGCLAAAAVLALVWRG